jgi:hypothetical protein
MSILKLNMDDNENNNLYFTNSAINLTTHNILNTGYHNNVNTGYALLVPDNYDNKYETLNRIIHDIFPDKIDRDNFIKMSKLAISGHRNNTMFIFLGDGANGKSILLSLLMAMLGSDYSCIMLEITLQLSMDNLRYQQLSYLENKRLVGVNSNAPKDIHNIDFLKKDNVMGHMLWKGKVDVKLNLTCVYIVNSLNDINDDILKNSTIINFKTKFVRNVVNNNEILMDTYIGSTLFETTYKHIMIRYILNYKY